MNIKDTKNLDLICAFEGDFAVFKTTDDKEGIVNRQGEIILEAKDYWMVYRDMDPAIYALVNSGAPIKHFDATTRKMVEVTDVEYYRSKNWKENIFVIAGEKGKGALSIASGKMTIPCENKLVSYKKQFHVILVENQDGKWGLFDEKGNAILPMEYDYLNISEDNGLHEIAVKKDGECYFLNAKYEPKRVEVF